MKWFAAFTVNCLGTITLIVLFHGHVAALPNQWKHQQPFTVTAVGMVKIDLPIETINVACPEMEDLRLHDSAGNEVPYAIERRIPEANPFQNAKSFQVSLTANRTVVMFETGLTRPLDTVRLETPSEDFIKPVKIEGSADSKRWQLLGQGQSIFRLPDGANKLDVFLPAHVWRWLRLTVDDRRTLAIPFTGARVRATAAAPAPTELLPATVAERDESPGETRLVIHLGAANLYLAAVRIETEEPLFTREITLAVPRIYQDGVREQSIGKGTVYRVVIDDQKTAKNLSVSLESIVHSSELVVIISNRDSPPLSINAIGIDRRPVSLVFLAKHAGDYILYSGDDGCSAPHYDLATLDVNFKTLAASPIVLPPLVDNPDYHAPEVLAGIDAVGSSLDVSAWKFSKPVKLSRDGPQELELDLDVLAHASPRFADLRLLQGGNQVPYIVEHTSISRSLAPSVTSDKSVKDPKVSRWILKLPNSGLPVNRLSCSSQSPLFSREVTLYEERTNRHGRQRRQRLGNARWRRTPEGENRDFALVLEHSPQGNTIFLETHNGDNPPIALKNFRLFYPATRILFKAKVKDKLSLYYGNPRVSAPQYDLAMVAGQLIAANKAAAKLAAEMRLRESSWSERKIIGNKKVVFWGMLALVVVVLLTIISRLLPKSPT